MQIEVGLQIKTVKIWTLENLVEQWKFEHSFNGSRHMQFKVKTASNQ